MKQLLTISLLVVSLNGFSLAEDRMPDCQLLSTIVDSSLCGNDVVYHFNFQYVSENNHKLVYSIDGITLSAKLKKQSLEIRTTAGKHIFQFYWSEDYEEVYTDSLAIEARHRATYGITFQPAHHYEIEKPVIYLYPEVSTKIQVVMDIKGSRSFMYPAYNDCWEFTARPNGDLIFGENTYNYLFWEAATYTHLIADEGFVVAGDHSTNFLEEKLTEMGFNSKEQADFITYWAPRMAKNEHNFVQFEFNEACDQYATMEITPKPDHIYRVYMLWTPISEDFQVKEQLLEKVDRTGFSVLEWGGQESKFRRINCMAHHKIEQ